MIEENTAEVISVRKYLILPRQKRTAAFHQVDAGQRVIAGNLLRPQMLLHGKRIVGAAFYGGIVGNHHAFARGYPSDAGDQAGARQLFAIYPLRRERGELEERGTGIEQRGDAFARQQFSGLGVLVARGRAAPCRIAAQREAQVVDQRLHRSTIGGEFLRADIEFGD